MNAGKGFDMMSWIGTNGSEDGAFGMLFLALITEGVASREGHDVFERFVRELYDPVVRFFSRRGCTPEESEDLAQDTFLRAYRSFDGFRGEAKESTWLLTIAANVWRNHVRDAETAKRDADEVDLPEDGQAPGAPSRPPLDEALDVERRRLLRSAMEELPAEMRRSVMLRVYQDMSYRDIADTLDISVQTAKSQVSRARPRLTAILSEHYPDLESRLAER